MADDPVFSGLIARGYAPVQAAAIAGNVAQESGGNPAAVNQGEDAHGLLQWRLDRWRGLQDFAKARGTDPTDLGTQLDYIGHEMAGPEAKSSGGFLAATDLGGANAALKKYIRYGDDSEGIRLRNAQGFLAGGAAGPATVSSQTASPTPPTGILSAGAPPASPTGAPGILNASPDDDGLAAQRAFQGTLANLMAQQQQQQAPIPAFAPINFAVPRGISRARLLSALQSPLGGS